MKLDRKQWLNVALLIGVALFLFTPVGFHARVLVGRLLSTNASVIKEELQIPLKNYDWQLVKADGQDFNFENGRNQVVLINFWATWCPPCVAEMPSLQNLYDDYGDKVVFMFVAEDEVEKVSAFMEKKEYKLPVYYSKTKPPNMLTSKTIPTTYIINKEGKIVVAETGVADWNSNKTRKLLDELVEE